MKTLIFMPYFLKKECSLPEWFQLFFNSCGENKEFEWLFITNKEIDLVVPDNVNVNYMEFGELREYIQSKFDFPISLEREYKLCDYKVLYGYIFSEYLDGYDFWGYCDSTDVIFGKLSNFITSEILKKYDKVYWKGHLTLYRNKPEYINCIFNYEKNGKDYRWVISDEDNHAMDETGEININDAWRESGYSLYVHDEDIADISCMNYEFRLGTGLKKDGKSFGKEKNKHRIFEWNHGKISSLYVEDKTIKRQEYAYVHFQKRDMKVLESKWENVKSFYIAPCGIFYQKEALSMDDLLKMTKHKIFYKKWFELKGKALKERIKRMVGKGKWYGKK